MIVNNTNRTYRLKRGCVVGKIEFVAAQNVVAMTKKLKEEQDFENDIFADLNVPNAHSQLIREIILQDQDIFAKKDSD